MSTVSRCLDHLTSDIVDYKVNKIIVLQAGGGWVYHLFVYIRWSYRMIALMLCYSSIAQSTGKDDISASAIWHI